MHYIDAILYLPDYAQRYVKRFTLFEYKQCDTNYFQSSHLKFILVNIIKVHFPFYLFDHPSSTQTAQNLFG